MKIKDRYTDETIREVAGNSLSETDLSGATLRYADLNGVNMHKADLRHVDFRYSDLSHANLSHADLSHANLRESNLCGANLYYADLHYADLSGTTGLLNAANWLAENLEEDSDGCGYIVYKRFGDTTEAQPWKPEPGLEITEVCHSDRTLGYACGVNWGTREWCANNYTSGELWRCLLEWRDLSDTVVPYNTDGEARSARLIVLERVEEGDEQ